MPTMNPIEVATRNTADRNSAGGMIGSGARSSWKTKATSASTLVAPSAKITGESHAYWLPPHVVSRISELTPRAISEAPSQST